MDVLRFLQEYLAGRQLGDPLLAERYPSGDQNAAYWAMQREATGGAPPDRVTNEPSQYSGGPLTAPLWEQGPASLAPIPHSPWNRPRLNPELRQYESGTNAPISDAPSPGPPLYWHEDSSLLPDRTLIRNLGFR